MKESTRVVIITDVPTPYRIPLFNQIKKLLSGKNISFTVIFDAKKSQRRKWVYDNSAFSFDQIFLTENISRKYKGLLRKVKKISPKVVVSIGFSIATIKMWIYTLLRRRKLFIWTGSTLLSTLLRENQLPLYNKLLRKFFFIQKRVGFVAYSTSTKEYLMSKGVSEERIIISLNTVDTTFFEQNVKKQLQAGLARNYKHLLYVGYLNKRKNVKRLLEIVLKISQKRKDFVFHIVGDGDEKEGLENFVLTHNLQDIVKFYGYIQKEDLVKYYASCGIFLFQTDFDIWGLVLNEAMASGLCCLSSVNAGSTHDLIKHGKNGFAVDFSEKEDVIAILHNLLNSPENTKQMGENAIQFIKQNATLEKSAASFVKVLEAELSSLKFE